MVVNLESKFGHLFYSEWYVLQFLQMLSSVLYSVKKSEDTAFKYKPTNAKLCYKPNLHMNTSL